MRAMMRTKAILIEVRRFILLVIGNSPVFETDGCLVFMEGGGAPTTYANILTDSGFAISPGAAVPVRSGLGGLGTGSRKIGRRQSRLWCRRSARTARPGAGRFRRNTAYPAGPYSPECTARPAERTTSGRLPPGSAAPPAEGKAAAARNRGWT